MSTIKVHKNILYFLYKVYKSVHFDSILLIMLLIYDIVSIWENQRAKGGLPSCFIGGANPPDERKEGVPMITYSDLFQFCIFIVALVSLCYQLFKGKRK